MRSCYFFLLSCLLDAKDTAESKSMGQFSYECSTCGRHEQFDWMTECVVKIGQVYVKGEYDGYGRVDVAVETNAAKFTQFREHCAATAKGVTPLKAYNDLMWQKRREWAGTDYPAFDPPTDVTGFVVIQVMLEQYREFFSSWSYGNHGSHFGVVNGCLVASDIICACADDDSKVHSKQLVDECNLFRADVMEDRYCVPAAVKDQVKDYLTLSEHYSLPKVELSDNDICTNDHKADEVNSAKKSDKWKQQQEVYSRFGLIVKIW